MPAQDVQRQAAATVQSLVFITASSAGEGKGKRAVGPWIGSALALHITAAQGLIGPWDDKWRGALALTGEMLKPARIIQQHCILQKKHTARKPAKEAPGWYFTQRQESRTCQHRCSSQAQTAAEWCATF